MHIPSRSLLTAALALGAVAALTTPLVAQPQTPTAAAVSAAPPPSGRRSWTADRRDFRVGDIITVIVGEQTRASSTLGSEATSDTQRDMQLGVATPSGPGVAAGVSDANSGQSRRRGNASRTNEFQGEISVRVVAVDPAGLLQVRGVKTLRVDKNTEQLSFSGWVRPQDVSAGNVVDSRRVSDAELAYSGKGPMGSVRGGILGRIVGAIWP